MQEQSSEGQYYFLNVFNLPYLYRETLQNSLKESCINLREKILPLKNLPILDY